MHQNILIKLYHDEEWSDSSVLTNRSSLSIRSPKESDLEEIITGDMTLEEIEYVIKTNKHRKYYQANGI